MSWMRKLYDTYGKAAQMELSGDESAPLPPSHTSQQAHIEITIDGDGNFLRATVIPKEETLIPATEKSMAARTNAGAPHPLCDKIQYVAGDYQSHGGDKNNYFDDFKGGDGMKDGYLSLIGKWSEASGNRKVRAVYEYVKKRRIVSDLVREKVLHLDENGKLIKKWPTKDGEPAIFKTVMKKAGEIDQGDAFVRWCVNIPGEMENRVWQDDKLIEAWVKYDSGLQEERGLCFVTGEYVSLSNFHPAKIRNSADSAKLISSNDSSGFTFRGRFTDSKQACSIGYEVSQKAHSALRWLIKRQGFHNDDQVIVAWEVSGKNVPPLMKNSLDAILSETDEGSYHGDFGQLYARKLNSKIAGYRKDLDEWSDIVVMGLDSSTPGRMAITYYRELNGSEFLARVENWHESYAWFQYYGKDSQFVGAPSPKDIAVAAYGRRLDPKISKSTIARILPCIVDGLPIPEDLEKSVFKRAKNRISLEYWEREKILGIFCGLYRGLHKEMNYKMALDLEIKRRDYLYGRMLAVAEWIEQISLFVAKEKRDTNAAKLMHRFSERPLSTWRHIELALSPYKSRLRGSRGGFLAKMESLLDEISSSFISADDFINDEPLSGEFLLGYHCQRRDLRMKAKVETGHDEDEIYQEGEN